MSLLAVTAVGADRPGIIARITGLLSDRGGNLEDTTMTVLSGHFAIMLLVDVEAPAEVLETDVARAVADLGLVVTVREVGEGVRAEPATHLLSVYGADRPGLVADVTSVLADKDVNVTDLTTRLIEGERPVYAMLFEVSVPADVDADALAAEVRAGTPDVEATLTPIDAAVL